MGGLGSIFSLGSTAASAIGGGKGGGSSFQSAGGVTGPQADYAQYEYDQGMVGNESQFANTGTGMSTMDTQGGTGVAFGKAQNLAKESDADESAEYQASQVANSNQTTNLSSLASLAKTANTQSNTTDSNSGEAAGLSGS
ncbi:MAG TPA: hypothetical protein VHT52_04140 [Stellaceae bacterium]|jgi:hypothetical protein|nr:hypothetical protein [Stellaceae bacterium]